MYGTWFTECTTKKYGLNERLTSQSYLKVQNLPGKMYVLIAQMYLDTPSDHTLYFLLTRLANMYAHSILHGKIVDLKDFSLFYCLPDCLISN